MIMNIILGKNVKIRQINSKTNLKIVHYLYKAGTIIGQKIIDKNYAVPIIEFKDYTRIWIFPEELEFI
uniref:cytochrome b6-f complex subunit PetP n=1 Tax=Anunuuluaehu liula TaxID=3049639 RepID=UPI0030026984